MRKNNYPGKYIVLEGIDGCGKSTQIKLLSEYLKEITAPYVVTAEPTKDSPFADKIATILKSKDSFITALDLQSLYVEDRNYHMVRTVIPALGSGKTVISDRSFISTFAYGMAFGLDFEKILKLHMDILGDNWIKPDVAFYIDIDVKTSLSRILKNRNEVSFFEKKENLELIRKQYLSLQSKGWMARVNGKRTPNQIFDYLKKKLNI